MSDLGLQTFVPVDRFTYYGFWRRHVPFERLAQQLGISRRTLQRWCEKGFVPGALKTSGGHWRIPAGLNPDEVNALASHQRRVPWTNRTKDSISDRLTAAVDRLSIDDVWRLKPEDDRYEHFFKGPVPVEQWQCTSGESLLANHPKGKHSPELRVMIAARELIAAGVPVTLKAVAARMGISRSMLYRITDAPTRAAIKEYENRSCP